MLAPYATAGVYLVRKVQVGSRDVYPGHAQRVAWVKPYMTGIAARRRGCHFGGVGTVDRVALHAHTLRRRKAVGAASASRGRLMALNTLHAGDVHVTGMIEPQGYVLGGINRI